MYIMMIIKFN